MKLFITFFFLFLASYILAQPVSIYVYSQGLTVPANNVYEPFFGAGNVTVTNGPATANYSQYDIVIFSCINQNFTAANVTDLVAYVQNGGHVVLSTEGSGVAGGGKLMSSVWNLLTGQSITETGAGASGTSTPPRFHNSNGPWHLSPDPNLTGSTTSYASFANFKPENVTHQRNLGTPSCGNIQGLSAVSPSRPNLGEGTLYIQGEVQYPYSNFANSPEVTTHASAIANMHFALLTNNQNLLTQLNTWVANLVVDEDFIGNDTTMCASDFTPFTRTSPAYDSYSWEDFQGNVLATTASYTIQDSGNYIIKTTGSFPQCDGVDTLIVTFNASPKASFMSDTVCLGLTTTFNNTTQITGGTIGATTWNFDDGTTDNTVSPMHEFLTSGSFNVELTTTSSNNCSHDTTIIVLVNDEPTADFSVIDDCIYNNPQFTENSNVSNDVITEWNWNFGEVAPATSIQSTDQTPSYVYTQSGSYDVVLVVKTDKGCDDTITKTTIRYPKPQVSFNGLSACKNDSVTFTNSSTINAPDNITSWVWNFGDGSPLTNQFEPKHKYTQDGFFNVTLIASSNNGCVSDLTSFVQVYPLPMASFTATTTCENGNPTNFFNTSIVSQGNIVSYNWDFDDNGAVGNNQFAQYNYSIPGTYNVELIVETNNGCKDTSFSDVLVNPKPSANFVADVKEGCYPYCTQFQDNSISNATSISNYFWIFGNGEVQTTSEPEVCFENLSHTNDANYNTTLIVTNNLGCKDTVTENNYITVWPKPLASFEVSPEETNMYESLINFTNLSEGGENYYWNYDDGIESLIFEEEHQYQDTGVYVPNLIVETAKGCKDTTANTIKIEAVLNIYIPSAFSPNGDGVNDYFFVKGFAIDFSDFEFLIFDRWGTLIYQTEENFPWDGTYKGDLAPQDNYIYQVRLKGADNKEEQYRGNFILLR